MQTRFTCENVLHSVGNQKIFSCLQTHDRLFVAKGDLLAFWNSLRPIEPFH